MQALFDLEATNNELKADLRDLYITSAKEVDAGSRKAIIVHVSSTGSCHGYCKNVKHYLTDRSALRSSHRLPSLVPRLLSPAVSVALTCWGQAGNGWFVGRIREVWRPCNSNKRLKGEAFNPRRQEGLPAAKAQHPRQQGAKQPQQLQLQLSRRRRGPSTAAPCHLSGSCSVCPHLQPRTAAAVVQGALDPLRVTLTHGSCCNSKATVPCSCSGGDAVHQIIINAARPAHLQLPFGPACCKRSSSAAGRRARGEQWQALAAAQAAAAPSPAAAAAYSVSVSRIPCFFTAPTPFPHQHPEIPPSSRTHSVSNQRLSSSALDPTLYTRQPNLGCARTPILARQPEWAGSFWVRAASVGQHLPGVVAGMGR